MTVSLKDEAVASAVRGATVSFPGAGALRVHPNPASVYRPKPTLRGKPQRRGPNRFDDPHHHYPVRYLAENLHVCLLEVLARLRPSATDEETLEEMTPGLEAEELADLVDPTPTDVIAAFLATNKVAVFTPTTAVPLDQLVDVFNPALLTALDEHHKIRQQLDRPEMIDGFADASGTVHLDQGLIRNPSTKAGRPVTQEISRLLIEILHLQGLRYYSRHESEDRAICWALHGDVPLRVVSVEALDPHNTWHRTAVRDVAARYRIALPPRWA